MKRIYIDTDIDGSQYWYVNGEICDEKGREYSIEEQSQIALSYKHELRKKGIDPAHLFVEYDYS